MTKPMMDLPMDTKNRECGCGGPPKVIETPCPECGAQGMRVKAGTVRYHLREAHRDKAVEKIYGLCLSPDCAVAWYAQDGTHHFTTDQTDTPIWTKTGADPKYVCYCNEITAPMIAEAIDRKGLRTMDEIVAHYRGEMQCACATRHPSGQPCCDEFEEVIREALVEYLNCRCT